MVGDMRKLNITEDMEECKKHWRQLISHPTQEWGTSYIGTLNDDDMYIISDSFNIQVGGHYAFLLLSPHLFIIVIEALSQEF